MARWLRVGFVLFAIAVSSTSARADEPRARVARAPVPLDGVAAVVDDVFVFHSDVRARARHYEQKLSKNPVERRAELVQLEKEMLARIIDETLMLRDAQKLKIETNDTEVTSAIAGVAQQNNLTRKQLDAEVQKAGYTMPEYQEEIRRQIIEQKWLMVRAGSKIDRKKMPDPAALQAAFEHERELLFVELRSHAYIEVR